MRAARIGRWTALALAATVGAAALGAQVWAAAAGSPVTAAKLVAAAPGEWLGHGRDYFEQRFSPLAQINQANVKSLGLAWHYDFGERQGLEATPVVHDGVIYVSTDFSEVWAFDARTGKKLWSYVPDTHYWQVNTCCSPINRGVALWGDKVYVGALDGRLIALNAKTGQLVWSTQTFPKDTRLSITGAPRVVKGVVIIGNGGAELGVRGFVAGYDAETGKQKWKFYTVPGKQGDDGEVSDTALKLARTTWPGGNPSGFGGGTPWDGMAYDPELDLLYVGVGNGSPWNAALRSPGGGDNLFLGSVIALRPETGQYVWHFQETPGDSWDYTSTQPIILADLKIGGQVRKTLLHAPKNGFFYVLDRATGKFIQGKNYGPMNWATGLDANGRPIENPAARYGDTKKPFVASPGPGGAHDWQPMTFSPRTGLVYIPATESSYLYIDDPTEGGAGPTRLGYNTGAGAFSAVTRLPSQGPAPANANAGVAGADTANERAAYILAWDPLKQQARFKVPMLKTFNGGLLSTAGGLVFGGNGANEFAAYQDATGERLWTFDTQTGVLAGPAAYELDGVQYVALMAGWGGTVAPYGGLTDANGPARLLVFKLGGKDKLPPKPAYQRPPIAPPAETETLAVVDKGAALFARNCQRCPGGGGVGGGLGPTGPADLRRSPFIQAQAAFDQVVRSGALQHNGMAAFGTELDADMTKALRAYIVHQAHATKAAN
jgi:alcohol dehydrogenase (cytochrome c)/quinohemoprotein ethanol dehydrogenase